MATSSLGRPPSGFSTTELLVIVAVLIGVSVASVAQFSHLRSDARHVLNVETAAQLLDGLRGAREAWRALGQDRAQADLKGFGNGAIDVNASGWPVATSFKPGDEIDSLMTDQRCAEVFNALVRHAEAAPAGRAAESQPSGIYSAAASANASATCVFTALYSGQPEVLAERERQIVANLALGELWITDRDGVRRHLACQDGMRAYQTESSNPASYCGF